ncbi:MAG: amino acid permease [Syntrophorhabdaceae bacterium]|nr:amino acid permease [Syntrophorhabdaceae bacterium]
MEKNNKKTLSLFDAVALIVGIVVGVGIFRTPSLVAANSESIYAFFMFWIAGGIISLIGAFCYAELATAYPHPGGDYHFIGRAFGKKTAFLFAWSRMTVIQTGSIAMLGFVFGDYASQVLNLGVYSSSIYALASTIILTLVNIFGIQKGKWTQNVLTGVKVIGLLIIFFSGILANGVTDVSKEIASSKAGTSAGLAMIFVLLTFGGWNEAAYISSEITDVKKNMSRSLIWSIAAITLIYVFINFVFVKTLGLSRMGSSDAIASDVMRHIFGDKGAAFISGIIMISALGSINATIITGSRTNYALGREFGIFRFMGRWNNKTETPINALIIQALITILLIIFGAITRKGFATTVEYTAPVFWFFFLLGTLSLIVLRVKDKKTHRYYKVPFYPYTPILFALCCLFMLKGSIEYTGIGALIGICVLLLGIPFLFLSSKNSSLSEKE